MCVGYTLHENLCEMRCRLHCDCEWCAVRVEQDCGMIDNMTARLPPPVDDHSKRPLKVSSNGRCSAADIEMGIYMFCVQNIQVCAALLHLLVFEPHRNVL